MEGTDRMSVLTDFFAATPDELAAMAIEWGPVPPAPHAVKGRKGFFGIGSRQASPAPTEPLGPILEAVQSKGILNVQVGVLDELVTGTPYEALESTGVIDAIARDNGEEGPWVFPLRRELRDALARIEDARAGELARQWGSGKELAATEPEDFEALEELIRDLAALARSAGSTERDIYVWTSL